MPPCPGNFFIFLAETGFHHAVQAGLKLLTSSDPPASALQSARITGLSHSTLPGQSFLNLIIVTKVLLVEVLWLSTVKKTGCS